MLGKLGYFTGRPKKPGILYEELSRYVLLGASISLVAPRVALQEDRHEYTHTLIDLGHVIKFLAFG